MAWATPTSMKSHYKVSGEVGGRFCISTPDSLKKKRLLKNSNQVSCPHSCSILLAGLSLCTCTVTTTWKFCNVTWRRWSIDDNVLNKTAPSLFPHLIYKDADQIPFPWTQQKGRFPPQKSPSLPLLWAVCPRNSLTLLLSENQEKLLPSWLFVSKICSLWPISEFVPLQLGHLQCVMSHDRELPNKGSYSVLIFRVLPTMLENCTCNKCTLGEHSTHEGRSKP